MQTEIRQTPLEAIDGLIEKQRTFFNSGATRPLDFRIEALTRLKDAITSHEADIVGALKADLGKSHEEAYLTEIAIVLQEIDYHLKHIRSWAAPEKVATPLYMKPSSSKIRKEPLGCTLIIAPWNYPFQLTLNPLVGAISAGNCALLKPSEFTPNTAALLQRLVKEYFISAHVAVVTGDQEVGAHVLQHKFDLIFFTGSTKVGKIVMRAAAEHLTPVILELGGKSPCIVDAEANLDIAAKRIAWGKSLNAGQTCIAPDYLLVQSQVKEAFLAKLAAAFKKFYGKDPQQSPYYGRLVSEAAFDRLHALLDEGHIYYGGQVDREDRYIAPTIIDQVPVEGKLMEAELFGPLLPVLTFDAIEEARELINSRPRPLALYYFGKAEAGEQLLNQCISGGACINDTIMHVGNHHLPFGGVGASGMGHYHGKSSFDAFSHQRAVVSTPAGFDLPAKYPPYRFFGLIKKLL
ncbi:MAG: aldehyde dehydrogenase [Nitritalea sp.]